MASPQRTVTSRNVRGLRAESTRRPSAVDRAEELALGQHAFETEAEDVRQQALEPQRRHDRVQYVLRAAAGRLEMQRLRRDRERSQRLELEERGAVPIGDRDLELVDRQPLRREIDLAALAPGELAELRAEALRDLRDDAVERDRDRDATRVAGFLERDLALHVVAARAREPQILRAATR